MPNASQKPHHPPPHVFIGCSSAALPLGREIKKKLEARREIVATVWDENLLDLGGIILDSLLRYVSSFDFAVLVLSADDFTGEKEGAATPSPRDNVIFELGLFMGVRGRRRTFAVIKAKDKESLKIPTDLDGYIALYLDPNELDDKLDGKKYFINGKKYFTNQIKKLYNNIKDQAEEAAMSLLPSAALASGYFHNFLVPVYRHLNKIQKIEIAGEKYVFENGNYQLVILLPSLLRQAGIEERNAHIKGLLSYRFAEDKREYGLFVYPPHPDEVIRFADYPTTLRSSKEIIERVLEEQNRFALPASLKDTQRRMEQQEVANFRKALDYLVEKRSEVSGLQKKITYLYVSDT